MARPKFAPTPEERIQVEALAGHGLSQEKIVLFIMRPHGKGGELKPISLPTLRKHFRKELDTGGPKAHSLVLDALFKTATDRKAKQHVQAAVAWLKARGLWTEQLAHAHSGGLELDLRGATEEELAVLEKFLRKRAADDGRVAANAA